MGGKDEVRVSAVAALAEGETRTFPLQYAGREREAFLLRHEGELRAFLNDCPHWSIELDLGDGHFFDPEVARIYCKNHGALFHPLSGRCETGPCLGRSLVQFAVRTEAGDAWVGAELVVDGERLP